jgi:hypothetical protein
MNLTDRVRDFLKTVPAWQGTAAELAHHIGTKSINKVGACLTHLAKSGACRRAGWRPPVPGAQEWDRGARVWKAGGK